MSCPKFIEIAVRQNEFTLPNDIVVNTEFIVGFSTFSEDWLVPEGDNEDLDTYLYEIHLNGDLQYCMRHAHFYIDNEEYNRVRKILEVSD